MFLYIHLIQVSLYNFDEMKLIIETSDPLEDGSQLLHNRLIFKRISQEKENKWILRSSPLVLGYENESYRQRRGRSDNETGMREGVGCWRRNIRVIKGNSWCTEEPRS